MKGMAVLDYSDVIFFGFAILFIFLLLLGSFWFGYWLSHRPDSKSPYSGFPLRRARDLSYYNIENVLRYLYTMHDYDNRIFDITRAAVCRETGRIFPNAITWYDRIEVDWSFLQKRYPGTYVSWGSLTDLQKFSIQEAHHSLEKFQTEKSSPSPSPRQIEKDYVFTKPGPLYVDIETKVLLGWQIVPNTKLEVLIVQKPKGKFELPKSLT